MILCEGASSLRAEATGPPPYLSGDADRIGFPPSAQVQPQQLGESAFTGRELIKTVRPTAWSK
jgi:hypothetical protein